MPRAIADALGAGRRPDASQIDLWRALRLARHASLVPLREDAAEDAIFGDLRETEDELSGLEEGHVRRPREALDKSLELGERARWLLWLQSSLVGHWARDPLAFLERDLDWIEASARGLREWDPRLAGGAQETLDLAAHTREELVALRLERWERVPTSGEPGEHPVGESLAREWLHVSEGFRVEGDLVDSAASATARGQETLKGLRAQREASAGRISALLSGAPREEALGLFARAAADLLDQASIVLSESLGSSPRAHQGALRRFQQQVETLYRCVGGAQGLLGAVGSAASRETLDELTATVAELDHSVQKSRRFADELDARIRMERSLGRRVTRFLENGVLMLLVVFLGLVLWEWRLPHGSPLLPYLYVADAVICAAFQADFLLRWAFARWSGAFFLRHFWLESLPAWPYGLFFHVLESGAAEGLRAVILVRLLGIRSVFLLIVRLSRVLVFLVRGTDRAIEKFRPALDRDVIFFDADPLSEAGGSPLQRALLGVEARRQRLSRVLYADLPWGEKASALCAWTLHLQVEATLKTRMPLPYVPRAMEARGEVHLERIVHLALDCDAAQVISVVGREGASRIARWIRFLDVPVLRWGPIFRRLAPAARQKDDAEAVATAAHDLGGLLQSLLGAMRFYADLTGISTGPQILDRIATTIVAASKRPAVRLLIFGGAFLLLKGLLLLLEALLGIQIGFLDAILRPLLRLLGWPLLILGSLCLAVLLWGRWLKRVAGEALDVYLRTADAHFYGLLKTWKAGRSDDDLAALFDSVLAPEMKLRAAPGERREDWIARLGEEVQAGRSGHPLAPGCGLSLRPAFVEDRSILLLLYQDFLDGPILDREDDKTAVQLLGNLGLHDLRRQTLGLSRKEIRKLEDLDLQKDHLLGPGPYFWFRFITESLAMETAKLILEYNTSCVPLEELPYAGTEKRERFESFLASKACPWSYATARRASKGMDHLGESQTTAHFTSLHFLAPSEWLDEQVEQRFGGAVLNALRRDRRCMVRDIFGTRPYHLLPRNQRVLNPYSVYQRYLSGARFIFLPLLLAWAVLRVVASITREVFRLVRDILGHGEAAGPGPSREANFDVAVRKINRMRKPYFMEALRLRAAVDIEYLGLRLPGFEREEGGPSYQDDLDFIGALESERKPIEARRAAALRDLRRFRALLAERGWIGSGMELLLKELDPTGALLKKRGEVLRALVTAYVTDHRSLRSVVTCSEEARRFVEQAGQREQKLGGVIRGLARDAGALILPGARRRRRLLLEYIGKASELGGVAPAAVRKALREFQAASPETERAVTLAIQRLNARQVGDDLVVDVLQEVAREHPLWTRKVILVRTLQALTVLDIRGYRDMIYSVGGYGDDAGFTSGRPGAARASS